MSVAGTIERKAEHTPGAHAREQVVPKPVMHIRTAGIDDAENCGRVLYAAFQALADHHRFPRDFPSMEVATGLARTMLANPAFHGVAAEEGGRFVGCSFIALRPSVAGIGPIAVDPAAQDRGVGRRLMWAAMDRAAAEGMASIRLAQAAYHNRSLCLYTKLGFQTRVPLSLVQGPALDARFPGYDVRPATEADLSACNQLCRAVHGFDRDGELRDAVAGRTAVVVEHLGRIAPPDGAKRQRHENRSRPTARADRRTST